MAESHASWVYQEQHVLPLRRKVLCVTRGHERGFQALGGRAVGGGHHQHGALQGLRP
jgi:hypothetical protein